MGMFHKGALVNNGMVCARDRYGGYGSGDSLLSVSWAEAIRDANDCSFDFRAPFWVVGRVCRYGAKRHEHVTQRSSKSGREKVGTQSYLVLAVEHRVCCLRHHYLAKLVQPVAHCGYDRQHDCDVEQKRP